MPTKIEWAEETWNPVTGCTPISPGCANCYAQRMAKRLAGRFGYPADEPFRVTLHPERLEEPFRWRKPRRVLVCSMGDLFHEDVPGEFIRKVFGYMHHCKRHTFMVLTKRPERMADFIRWYSDWVGFNAWPREYSHAWLGVTAENQARADERIPILLQTPAAVRFVSCEPLLGHINIAGYLGWNGLRRMGDGLLYRWAAPKIDWVICGGETGPGARPLHPDWVRSLRDQCQAAGVPFFFKSFGEWASDLDECNLMAPQQADPDDYFRAYRFPDGETVYRVGKKAAGRLLDALEHNEMPEVE